MNNATFLAIALLGASASWMSTPALAATYDYLVPIKNLKISPQDSAPVPNVDKGLIQIGGVRTWSDNSLASSCNAYHTGDAQHQYVGATGDGPYRINLLGTPTDVYCDMTKDGGGWTLVIKGIPTANSQHASFVTTGTLSLEQATGLSGSSFKFADATINALKSTAYRVTSSGTYSITRFFKPTCVYSSVGTAQGDCNVSYQTLGWTGQLVGAPYSGVAGLSDWNMNVSLSYVISSDSRGVPYSWFVGDGVTTTGYGADYGYHSPSNLYVWVR